MPTKTSKFGTTKREAHDASDFYNRNLYANGQSAPEKGAEKDGVPAVIQVANRPLAEWADQLYCQSAESMSAIPDNSVGLAFTSPPYNVGKSYDDDMSMEAYLGLIETVGREVYRVLKPGGRYVINIANLGRKPYVPLHAYYYERHGRIGFLPMGEIIWQKGKGASGSCAWGSWRSAKAPRLRDLHEYLLVFAKEAFSRPDKGESTLERDEFMRGTLSIWEIPPASARKIGHPAPFPVELATRVIRLFSYLGDVILDPFAGSGTTCVAAQQEQRHYVGYELSADYCALAKERVFNLTS